MQKHAAVKACTVFHSIIYLNDTTYTLTHAHMSFNILQSQCCCFCCCIKFTIVYYCVCCRSRQPNTNSSSRKIFNLRFNRPYYIETTFSSTRSHPSVRARAHLYVWVCVFVPCDDLFPFYRIFFITFEIAATNAFVCLLLILISFSFQLAATATTISIHFSFLPIYFPFVLLYSLFS